MRRRVVIIALLCSSFIAAGPMNGHAQDTAPATEIFVGGAKLWEHASGGLYHNSGPALAVTGNFNRFLGLEMDLNKFQDIPLGPFSYGDYFRVLFGPHFAYNGNSRVSPFAHVLAGLTRGRQCGEVCASEELGGNAFTTAIGGGVDVKVFRFLWIRPIQADYVRVFFPKVPENNLQLSFGFTFRFGSLKQR